MTLLLHCLNQVRWRSGEHDLIVLPSSVSTTDVQMSRRTGQRLGVNTSRNSHGDPVADTLDLARSTDDEKQSQLNRLEDFHEGHKTEAPAMLEALKQAVSDNGNVFERPMQAVSCCSLEQNTDALFQVGGQYRRSI